MQEIESADEAHPKSFLKAKWYPVAASTLALVIAIGGHAFTAFNSVQVANHGNRIDGLEAFKLTTENAYGGRDREFQALQAELGRLQRQGDEQRAEIAQLKAIKPSTVDKSEKAAASTQENEKAQHQSESAKTETKPLPNGVSPKFDSVIRDRMKPYWEQPPALHGGENMDAEDIVILQFKVERNGFISNVGVANTSGQIEFDNAAVKAALRMAQIPEIARLNDQSYQRVSQFRIAFNQDSFK
jgi:TonB family protein